MHPIEMASWYWYLVEVQRGWGRSPIMTREPAWPRLMQPNEMGFFFLHAHASPEANAPPLPLAHTGCCREL